MRASAIADGAVAECTDGSFSDNLDFGATCSGGGGVRKWLSTYGECVNGTVIKMSKSASCEDHGGFKALKSADFIPAASKGDVALCTDGTFSDNTDFAATCSSHGGVDRWLATYGECKDGTIITMSVSASCTDQGGFKGLKESGYTPRQGEDDVARCGDGTFSNNTKFSATCSSHGGVDRWLATYGECKDGTIITMSKGASCSSHGGFTGLKPKGFVPPPTTTTTTLSEELDSVPSTNPPGSTPETAPEFCEPATDGLFLVISDGLKPETGAKLEHIGVARSADYTRAYFVAGRISIPGEDSQVATWVTNDLDGNGLVYAVSGFAQEFSDWGDGTTTDARFSMADDGADRAEDCL